MLPVNNLSVESRQQLISGSTNWCYRLASLFIKKHNIIYSEEREDIVASAFHGLCYAATVFDNEKGMKFNSYSTWWIRQRMGAYWYRYNHPKGFRYDRITRIPKDKSPNVLNERWKESINDTEYALLTDLVKIDSTIKESDNRIDIDTILSRLDYQERYLIERIYFEKVSFHELGDELKMSKGCVSRKHDKTIKKLQEIFIEGKKL